MSVGQPSQKTHSRLEFQLWHSNQSTPNLNLFRNFFQSPARLTNDDSPDTYSSNHTSKIWTNLRGK